MNEETSYRLLRHIEENPDISQRELAKAKGISLAKTNYCLKGLMDKGWSTPLDDLREPDLSFVIDTLESLVPDMRKGQITSLESTTYPGTTEEELKPRIENTCLKVGEDVFLIYSPEREDPGNTLAQYDCIVLATDHDAFDCDLIGRHARLLVDTRGRYWATHKNIVKA